MVIKLFVSDIDQTLVVHRVGIPRANVLALKKLQKSGVMVALASGRMAQAMYDCARELELDQHGGFIIASNGAYVEALAPQRVLRRSTFSVEQIQRFALSAVFHGAHFTVDQGHRLLYTHHDHSYRWAKSVNTLELQQIYHVPTQLTQPATRCSVSVDDFSGPYAIDAFIRAHQHEASFERLNPRYLDMMPVGNSKWVGLHALMEHLRLSPEQVAAIGDGENDRSMLARVGFAATLQNALPSIQAMAHVVVADVAKAGVAQFADLVLARNAHLK
jgi:Cof subfamily protein (haloacid dehalogenase superfamily)